MLAITELFEDPELRRRSEEERGRLRALLAQRVDAFNRLASEAGLRYPRYEGGFFVAVFTKDAARCAARMREDGVYVVPLKGAVRVALCATPVDALPRLVRALKTGVEHAGG
jgi:aromatic-amino-acid transaminase